MQRNDLINQLATDKDNDSVTVDVNGVLIDVDAVTTSRGSIVVLLNPEDIGETLRKVASGELPVRDSNTL